MNLAHGGHLTHGSPVNMSGTYFHFVPYGVDADTGRINYDELMRLAMEHKPKLIVAGASAYARAIDFAKFREVADAAGAYLMVDMAHIRRLGGSGAAPVPGALCRCGYHHYPQDPARAPRRVDPLPGSAGQAD